MTSHHITSPHSDLSPKNHQPLLLSFPFLGSGIADQLAGQVRLMIIRAQGSKKSKGTVEMAPNAMTTCYCQIQLRPGGVVTSLPSVDPVQSLGGSCGTKPLEVPELLHFTMPKY